MIPGDGRWWREQPAPVVVDGRAYYPPAGLDFTATAAWLIEQIDMGDEAPGFTLKDRDDFAVAA